MTRKYVEAVLLEFEGVIADTSGARRAAMGYVLAEDGLQLSDADYRDVCAGRATPDAVRAAIARCGVQMDDTGLELLALRVDRAFSNHLGKGITLIDGAREALERLASRARLGIVTRASRRDVDFVLNLARMDEIFACVVGAEDAYPPKPDPAAYRLALRRLERQRPIGADGIVVALEEGRDGIVGARSAGLRCVAVGDIPAHVAMEADAFIPAITGLDASMLGRLLSRTGEEFA